VSIENLTGSEFADTLIGDANPNILSGAGGRDILLGGDGPDTIDGGASVDKADYGGSPLGVTVDLSLAAGVAQTSAGAASGDKLFNIEDVSGSSFGDVLKGNDGANRLSGRGGDDRLEGGGNSDNYIAGAGLGADRIFDSGGADDVLTVSAFAQIVSSTHVGDDLRIVYSDGGSVVIEKHFLAANRIETAHDLATNISVVLASGNIGGSGSGIISGTTADDFLDGRGGNDLLFGNAGVDHLVGGRGNDWLAGGAGNDRLTGGPGKNVFAFNTALDAASNVDTITDFDPGRDIIRLDNAVFTALKAGELRSKAFHIGKQAGDHNDHIVYDSATGDLFYDSDGKGGAAAVLFATLHKRLDLDHNDFDVL
jgi:serralysin